MINKIIVILIMEMFILIPSLEAAKIDVYRDILLNKKFTIKYDINTPPTHRTNKEGILGSRGLVDTNDTVYKSDELITGGIIVVDNDDKYIEQILGEHKFAYKLGGNVKVKNIKETGICNLFTNDETFTFYWDIKDEQKRYYGGLSMFGGKSNKVKANEQDKYMPQKSPYQKMIEEYNYGSPVLAQAFTAILPLNRIITTLNIPQYKFIKSGTLSDGLNYEDFSGSKDNIFYAVRYYFNGDKLVKIATFNYLQDATGIKGYEKSVVDITEFSSTPDKKYLSLPEGLKDVTKRDKKEEIK